MLTTAATTICLLLCVLQPPVQSYPTWYHRNGQYGVPDYSSRRKVHFLQEGRPVHSPNVAYRFHRGNPRWNLPYDTTNEPVATIPLLNSISQKLSAYMQTTPHLRNRLATMGWHGAQSTYHNRYPYRRKEPVIRPSHTRNDHIRPASAAINTDQQVLQAGVLDRGLGKGGRKKILGSLPHYMILEATPASERPGLVLKYGEGEKHTPVINTNVLTLSSVKSPVVEATPSTLKTSLSTGRSPITAATPSTSKTPINWKLTLPSTLLGENKTKDTGLRGQEVNNYTAVLENHLITTTPTIKEKTTMKEEIVHHTPVVFVKETIKSILENNSATENPSIPVISLSGEDLKLIEGLKPGLHDEEGDTSGFLKKGESIYVEFPDAAFGKVRDDQNVKANGNVQDNIMSGISKLLKELIKKNNQNVTPAKNLTDNKPGSTVDGRTKVLTTYNDSVNQNYNNSTAGVSRDIVLTSGVKETDTSSTYEPTTVTSTTDTDYDVDTTEYNTESTTVVNHINIGPFPSKVDVPKGFGSPTATLESPQRVTAKTIKVITVGQDTRTEPNAVTTLEDFQVTTEDHGRVGQEGITVPSGIMVPDDVTFTTESYSHTEQEGISTLNGVVVSEEVTVTAEDQGRVGQEEGTIRSGITVPEIVMDTTEPCSQERSPQLNEAPFTEDATVTTARPHQEQGHFDGVTIEDVGITTEHLEDLGKEGRTELIGVTVTEDVDVSLEEMEKEGTTDSIIVNVTENFTDSMTRSDQATEEGQTFPEDVEVRTESIIPANTKSKATSTPQQPEERLVIIEYDEDLNTTTNHAYDFTTNVATEYTTEIWMKSSTEYTGEGKSVGNTTQVIEIKDYDGDITTKPSDNETAHGEGVNTGEYFTSTESHGISDSVSEITEACDGEVSVDTYMGQDQNVTPNEKLSIDLPQTIITDPSPDELVETTTAFKFAKEIGKQNAVTARTSKSVSQMVPTNPIVEERTWREYLTEIYKTINESTTPVDEDSTIQSTHDTLAEWGVTANFTDNLNTISQLDGVHDVQPTSTLAFTNDLNTQGRNGDSESSTEQESKELISSSKVTGNKDGLTGGKIAFEEENTTDINDDRQLTTDINVPVTEETDIPSAVNQSGTTPQPVEEVTESLELESPTIPEFTTTQNAYDDINTTEEMQTVSSVEGSQDLAVGNPRKGNANSKDQEIENDWQNVNIEESLQFSTVYAEIGEPFTTQIRVEVKSSDIENGTNTLPTALNIVGEISTNEPFEFTSVEKEDINTEETPELSTQTSPFTGLWDDGTLPHTTVEHISSVQHLGLTTGKSPTNVVDNQELKPQGNVTEVTSTIHYEKKLPRNDDLILATTVREPSSTDNESVLSTQTTIGAETTERDVLSTAQTVGDEQPHRDDLDITTHAVLEETTTSYEGMQDSEEPLKPGERTVVTIYPALNNEISTSEGVRQLTTQSPSEDDTSGVHQGPNITPSSTSAKDTPTAEDEKEVEALTVWEETSTVEIDLKSTTNTGTEYTDTTTENYVATTAINIAEDSSTVQGDADLKTEGFEFTTQDKSYTVTKEQEVTTKKLTEEENTISPEIKVLTPANLEEDGILSLIPELENESQNISGEESFSTESVLELTTQASQNISGEESFSTETVLELTTQALQKLSGEESLSTESVLELTTQASQKISGEKSLSTETVSQLTTQALQKISGEKSLSTETVSQLTTQASQKISGEKSLSTETVSQLTTQVSQNISGEKSLSTETVSQLTTQASQKISGEKSLSTETVSGLTTPASQNISREESLSNKTVSQLTTQASQKISGEKSLSTETVSQLTTQASQKISGEESLSTETVSGLTTPASQQISGEESLSTETVTGLTTQASQQISGEESLSTETVSGLTTQASQQISGEESLSTETVLELTTPASQKISGDESLSTEADLGLTTPALQKISEEESLSTEADLGLTTPALQKISEEESLSTEADLGLTTPASQKISGEESLSTEADLGLTTPASQKISGEESLSTETVSELTTQASQQISGEESLSTETVSELTTPASQQISGEESLSTEAGLGLTTPASQKISGEESLSTEAVSGLTTPASQQISGEESLSTEAVSELTTQADIEEATPKIYGDFKTATKATDGEETSTVEEEPETEALTTAFPWDEESSTLDMETSTEPIETVTVTYEAHTILDFNPPVEKADASTRSSVLKSTADTSRRSDIEIDYDNHDGNFYPYEDLLQKMFHGMSSSTEKITSFTTENNAKADDIDVRISAVQRLNTNSEDIDARSGRNLIPKYNERKEHLFQEEKIILESSTVGNDESIFYANETDSTAIYNPDSKLLMGIAEVRPYIGISKTLQEDADLVFEELPAMSPTSTGEASTTERLDLNQISTVHLNTLDYPQPSDEPNPDDHQPTFSVWELFELIPVIIEELRNGHITEEEYNVFGEIFGDLWPVLVAEAKGSVEREDNGQPGIGEMLSKIMEDQEMQELMAERHRRNQHIYENNHSPLLTALRSHRNSKVQSWRPLPGGSGIARVFSPRLIDHTTSQKRNVQLSDFSEETQETRNIIRRLKNVKMDTWLMLWDILSDSQYFRGERNVDGSGHSEAETMNDMSSLRPEYLPIPNSEEDDTEMDNEYEIRKSLYDDDYKDDDAKISDLFDMLPEPPKLRED